MWSHSNTRQKVIHVKRKMLSVFERGKKKKKKKWRQLFIHCQVNWASVISHSGTARSTRETVMKKCCTEGEEKEKVCEMQIYWPLWSHTVYLNYLCADVDSHSHLIGPGWKKKRSHDDGDLRNEYTENERS